MRIVEGGSGHYIEFVGDGKEWLVFKVLADPCQVSDKWDVE